MGSADVMGMAEFRSFGETKTKKKKRHYDGRTKDQDNFVSSAPSMRSSHAVLLHSVALYNLHKTKNNCCYPVRNQLYST